LAADIARTLGSQIVVVALCSIDIPSCNRPRKINYRLIRISGRVSSRIVTFDGAINTDAGISILDNMVNANYYRKVLLTVDSINDRIYW
jgi:hypothetical protein